MLRFRAAKWRQHIALALARGMDRLILVSREAATASRILSLLSSLRGSIRVTDFDLRAYACSY